MSLSIFFRTTEETIDSVNSNLPVVKLSTSGKSAFGGNAVISYILPENAGGTTSVANHIGADNSSIFNTKTDVFAKMALLFNSHGGYVTPMFGQAITSSDQPFNFAGIALTPTQEVSDNWIKKTFTSVSLPAARDLFGMTYMDFNQKVIIFGGENNGSLLGDTWSWDGTIWTQLHSFTSPSARRGFSTTYDSGRKLIMLFGGIDGSNTVLNDTWEYDGVNWISLTGSMLPPHSPSARNDYALEYDLNRSKTVLFGGRNGTTIYNETWEYNGADWAHITTATSPGIRFRHAMTFDSSRNKIVLFGGIGVSAAATTVSSMVSFGDEIIHVVSTSSFPTSGIIFINSEYISYTGITPTTFTGCVRALYDSAQATHSISAAVSGLTTYGDTWEYDGVNWTERFITGSLPIPRAETKLVFSATKKVAIMFGGLGDPTRNTNDLSDTWEYDGNSWTQLSLVGPSPRENFGMTYDSNRDRVVVFGGENTSTIGANGETWEFGSPFRPIIVQTSGEGLVYYDSSPGRPIPVVGDFLGPSSEAGTVTPLYDGYSPVFGIAVEQPLVLTAILSTDVNSFVTTITVGSTSGFPFSGTITIDGEQITYTATTSTTFTGCVRGSNSTTATNHVARTIVFSTVPLQLTVNNATVGIIKMKIRPFYGFIPPLPPSITNFSPSAGVVGDTIILDGTVFIGTSQVTIDDAYFTNATFDVISNNQITFIVPAGGQQGTITVTNAQGNSTSITQFTTLPIITNITAPSFSVGSIIAIHGHTFTYTTSVKFNGVSAAYSFVNDGYVTATIPIGGTSGDLDLTITYPSTDTFTTTYHNFSVVAVPTISNVVPLAGAIGSFVSITGTGFDVGGSAFDGYGTIDFIDVATMTQILPATRIVFNDTTISAITPTPGSPQPSTAYYVRLITNGGTVLSSQQYTIIPIPKFLDAPGPTFISQTGGSSGTAGDEVRIFGDYGFTGVFSVNFDGYSAPGFDGYPSPSIHFVNDGYVTAIVPNISSSIDIIGPISVTSIGGKKSTADSPATAPINFTILQTPTISSFSPSSGKTGDVVVILGTNLLSVSSVKFESMSTTATFSIVNSGRINVTVPPSGSGILFAPTLVHIIIDKGIFEVTSAGTYLYYPPPTSLTIANPSVDGGGINGGVGTSVTLDGYNLNQGGTPIVTFGGVGAIVTSASPGNVIVTVPSGGSGISLTTLGGTATIGFNFLAPCSISSFYTDWLSDHHAATPYYPSIIDLYGSNFRNSSFMVVEVIDPSRGYETISVPFTFHDSTHVTFNAALLGDFSGGDTCYIRTTTFFPGGSYTSTVFGLFVFFPIV